jgi:NAD(P)-dependent dehydrogenase (short-subunit alcohol dehydrogenase family)
MRPALSESIVVVTGASSGIGRATALALAREGAAIVVCARWRGARWTASVASTSG